MTAMAKVAPTNSAGPAPVRRARSLRRTSSMDMSWPEGRDGDLLVQGRARDIFTAAAGSAPRTVADDRVRILSSRKRAVVAIDGDRCHADLQRLIGERGGGHFRTSIAEAVPEELAACSPLSFLLDDFSGASLVSPWAWGRWPSTGGMPSASAVVMEGICSGFQPGASSLLPDGRADTTIQSSCQVGSLVRDDDPEGWHSLPVQEGVGMRRARRIDLWFEGDTLQMDIGFQDSATQPQGGRVAVHEYHVRATADEAMVLTSVVAEPRVLPYPECPGASANVGRMVGRHLAELGTVVPLELHGTAGCTHLNDVLRLLSHVPRLSLRLREQLAA